MTSNNTPMPVSTPSMHYDPYSLEAMTDPRRLYAEMRAVGPVHYLPDYNAWAIAGFDEVWQICRDTKNFTTIHGMPPNSALLGEPPGVTFTALPVRDHAVRRRILQPAYRSVSIQEDLPYLRLLAREVLMQHTAAGRGELDVRHDYTRRVTARFACYRAGLPDQDAERILDRINDIFEREPGQKGSSTANAAAAAEVAMYLRHLVRVGRANPSLATGDLATLLAGSIDGEPLSDEEIVGDVQTLLVTGSDTTETTAAATLYYLAQHPDQLAAVRADPALIPQAFLETARYDHPTDVLCREVVNEVEVGGQRLLPGQGVMLLWGSANRDEKEFPEADRYDIHREFRRHLIFGHGQHKCLGENLALAMGTVLLEEFFEAVASYQVDFDRCVRKNAEFVKGLHEVPLRFVTA